MPGDELAAIRQAAKGLMYPSESDYPLDVVRFDDFAASARDAVEGKIERRGKLEEVSAETFWSELADADGAEGFARLRSVMEATLTDVGVIRLGEVRIDVYVIGRAKSGEWIGVHTASVET